mmetsp:Transcript_7397/g.9664  ORF Transcript_7397/g.9664 Transcript_7397/m.9664 type:complete len:93 (-) Transcript_7397:394-672(-)
MRSGQLEIRLAQTIEPAHRTKNSMFGLFATPPFQIFDHFRMTRNVVSPLLAVLDDPKANENDENIKNKPPKLNLHIAKIGPAFEARPNEGHE